MRMACKGHELGHAIAIMEIMRWIIRPIHFLLVPFAESSAAVCESLSPHLEPAISSLGISVSPPRGSASLLLIPPQTQSGALAGLSQTCCPTSRARRK